MLGLVLGAGPRPAAAQAPPAAKGTGGTDVLHRLQVCEDGSLMGWGDNANFVLAQPNASAQYAVPLANVGQVDKFAVAATASGSSFALSPDGTLYAWGDNTLGQLGLGGGPQATHHDQPTPVSLPRPAVAVAAADKFALVLLDDGSVWAWGSNAAGELGTGSTGPTSYDPVPTLLTSGSTAIACGDGFGLALDQNGQVRAWGRGTHGELGLGSPTGPGVSTPQPTPTLVQLPDGVRQLTASATAVGAIMEDGQVYTWGNNTSGQLGLGTVNSLNPTPAPVALPEPDQTLELAVAKETMCLLLRDGRTLVWGQNSDGAFGDCASPLVSSSVPVDGPRFDGECNQIRALGPRAFAVTSQDGQVLVWGKGPTGYPTYLSSCQPDTPLDLCRARTAPLLLAHADQTSACAGSTVRLYAVASQPGLTFHWQALNNPAVASTNAPYFSVRLEQSTTFRVTTELPGGCPGPEATVTVTVNANCCTGNFTAAERLQVNTPYTPATLTFQPYQRYYVRSNQSLVLTGGTFIMPEGATLYLGANANVQLLSGAELVMRGATITSACDTMWTAINVLASAVGIRTEASGSIRSRIQHGISGVVLEDGPAGGTAARFQFTYTDFRHNRQSIGLTRINVAGTANDQLQYCSFDSDPTKFGVPYKPVGTERYYSQQHIGMAGDVRARAWSRNTFAHAMFGILVVTRWGYFDLVTNTFSDCFVAGVSTGDISNPTIRPNPYGFEARLTGNYFVLPKEQPGTQQRILAAGAVIQPIGTNSFGVNLIFVRTQAYDNTFEQPGVLYPSYNFTAYRERQIGLSAFLLDKAERNTFRRLAEGINVNIGGGSSGYSSEVRGNEFDDCEKGIAVSTRTSTYPASHPGLTDAVLYSSCNSFIRSATRPGRSYGIYYFQREPGVIEPPLLIDEPGAVSGVTGGMPGQTILKDLFDENGVAPGGFFAIFNSRSVGVSYTTFKNDPQGQSNYTAHYQQYSSAGVTVSPGSTTLILGPGGNSCLYQNGYQNGIQTRATGVTQPLPQVAEKAGLAQNAPNPCSGSTTISYQLPVKAQRASLVIRRGLDGSQISRQSLSTKDSAYTLDLRDYKPGIYFYTLFVNDAPVATQRMLVQ